ncbi:hypothetical protein [Micromonospora sp. NPDC005205]|uniref:hypothetical protein n=1 Tax=Micromonospora sp. NPDC005205 TaxID=3156714 RepID=UPI0033ABB85B
MTDLRAVAITAVTASALIVAGCSAGGDPDKGNSGLVASPPPVTGTASASSPKGLVLPLEAYQTTNAQELMLSRAHDELTTACMRRFGFTTFTLNQSDSPQQSGRPEQMTRRYGPVSDAKDAAEYGYHLTPGQNLAPPAKSAGSSKRTSSETLVLTGSAGGPKPQPDATQSTKATYGGEEVPAGGCYGETGRKLAVDPSVNINFPQILAVSAYDQSRADSRVRDVVTKWSACMSEKGYNIKDPVDAAAGFSLDGAASAKEIQQAVADVACKEKVKLVSVWFSVESAYAQKLIEQNQQQLTAVRNQLDVQLRNAAQTLGQAVPR